MLFTMAGRKVFLFVSEVHWKHPRWAMERDAGHALQGAGEGLSQAGAPELEKEGRITNKTRVPWIFIFLLACF